MNWEEYVEEQKAALAKALQDKTAMFKEAGINPESLPAVDLNRVEPEVRQELQLKYGIDLSEYAYKPKLGASMWRQRTKAIMV